MLRDSGFASTESLYIMSPSADQSIGLVRLLRENGFRKNVIGVRMAGEAMPPRRLFKHCEVFSGTKKPFENGTLLPTGARSTEVLLAHGPVYVGDIRMTQDALKVFEKTWIIEQAAASHVPVPQTWNSLDEIDEAAYPIFYKQKYEQGGGVRGLAHLADDVPIGTLDDLIFQEYIDSPGTYGVGFIAQDGQLLVSHQHFERESLPKQGGSAVIIERFDDDRLLSLTQRLLTSIGFSGWGLAEFKYCPRRDDYVFMEINAKLWASCEVAFRNEPEFMRLLFGLKTVQQDIRKAVFVNRFILRGPLFTVTHFHELIDAALYVYPGSARQVAARLVPERLKPTLKSFIRRGEKS